MVLYDTGNNVVFGYRRLSCSIIMNTSIACSKCIQDFLHPYLYSFGVDNFFGRGVIIALEVLLSAVAEKASAQR